MEQSENGTTTCFPPSTIVLNIAAGVRDDDRSNTTMSEANTCTPSSEDDDSVRCHESSSPSAQLVRLEQKHYQLQAKIGQLKTIAVTADSVACIYSFCDVVRDREFIADRKLLYVLRTLLPCKIEDLFGIQLLIAGSSRALDAFSVRRMNELSKPGTYGIAIGCLQAQQAATTAAAATTTTTTTGFGSNGIRILATLRGAKSKTLSDIGLMDNNSKQVPLQTFVKAVTESTPSATVLFSALEIDQGIVEELVFWGMGTLPFYSRWDGEDGNDRSSCIF